jgi:outer membrane biosynthesis protein TonB
VPGVPSVPSGGPREGIVTGASSLPPLKKNDGKYGLIALLLLLGAGGLWFFFRSDDPEPPPEAEPPPVEAPAREQFAPAIEIPEEDAGAEEPPSQPPRASEEPVPSNPQDWECSGSINTAEVRAVITGAASKQVQTCYERGLKENNLLQGSMEVELTIGASGSVHAVSIGGTLRDRQVHACVKRVAKSWKFPRPTGGCVRINVPFQMTPKL